MVLPLIPLILGAASVAAGALGIKKGLDAKKTLDLARSIGENAERKYRTNMKMLDDKRKLTNQELESLGEYKKHIFEKTLGYVVQQVKNAQSKIEGIDENIISIDSREIAIFDKDLTNISALEISSGAVQGLTSSAIGAFGAYGTVGIMATASTGTAISTLSGVAATNATLAWLGGGSLASGGLGIVGGTWVLGGLVAGPALAVAGYTLASKAEEALTKAEEYKHEIDIAIAELEYPSILLDAIQSNINDVRYVLGELVRNFSLVSLDYEKHLLKGKGWRRWYAKIRGTAYQKKIRQNGLEKLGKIILFGKTIKSVISEPLIDHKGAAVHGFNIHISGVAKIQSIDFDAKCCSSCGKEISSIVRTCEYCNAIQESIKENCEHLQPVDSDTNFNVIYFVILIVIISMLGYWYFYRNPKNTNNTGQKTQIVSMVSSEATSSLVDTIFQPKTLHMNIQYFESFAGSAKYVENTPPKRVYEIQGCVFTATLLSLDQPTITSLTVNISPNCSADLGKFFQIENQESRLSNITFGKLENLIGGQLSMNYFADCLRNCGNSYDPAVYSHWIAPRSLQYLEMKANVLLITDESLESAGKWQNVMIENEGEGWVLNGNYNCFPNKYNFVAHKEFANITITSITFGYKLNEIECSQ